MSSSLFASNANTGDYIIPQHVSDRMGTGLQNHSQMLADVQAYMALANAPVPDYMTIKRTTPASKNKPAVTPTTKSNKTYDFEDSKSFISYSTTDDEHLPLYTPTPIPTPVRKTFFGKFKFGPRESWPPAPRQHQHQRPANKKVKKEVSKEEKAYDQALQICAAFLPFSRA